MIYRSTSGRATLDIKPCNMDIETPAANCSKQQTAGVNMWFIEIQRSSYDGMAIHARVQVCAQHGLCNARASAGHHDCGKEGGGGRESEGDLGS